MENLEILKLFPESVFKYKFKKFKEFNPELSKYIYNLNKEDSVGINRSNKGGWHSKDFDLRDRSSIQLKFALELQNYILNTFKKLGWKTENKQIQIKSMWAIINKKEDFNVVHSHPNSLLSAAYYVKAPQNCGRFQVENPNNIKKHITPELANENDLNVLLAGIEISEGDLIIFPGYLPHKVAKNESDEDRIVISFNVDIK
tara:strand:+ start:652 stop:1254 length:603 start_codon:yes stop_codon:yes gene_type:complete